LQNFKKSYTIQGVKKMNYKYETDTLRLFKETSQSQKIIRFNISTGNVSSTIKASRGSLLQLSPYARRSTSTNTISEFNDYNKKLVKARSFFSMSEILVRSYESRNGKTGNSGYKRELWLSNLYKLYATKVRLLEKYRNKRDFLLKKKLKPKFIGNVFPLNPRRRIPLNVFHNETKENDFIVDFGLTLSSPLNSEVLYKVHPVASSKHNINYITSAYGSGLVDVIDWSAYFRHAVKQSPSVMRNFSEQTLIDFQEVFQNNKNFQKGFPEVVFGYIIKIRASFLIVAVKGFYAKLLRTQFFGSLEIGKRIPFYFDGENRTALTYQQLNNFSTIKNSMQISLNQKALRAKLQKSMVVVLKNRKRADSLVG
jgi:hypothetical protein